MTEGKKEKIFTNNDETCSEELAKEFVEKYRECFKAYKIIHDGVRTKIQYEVNENAFCSMQPCVDFFTQRVTRPDNTQMLMCEKHAQEFETKTGCRAELLW
ncbi:hypothetical protein COV18_04545 [Candidatus Woesearchaeota archaeon CG10_big_fil_rev_8_21_14_0_10_37_12]|nr:MAG: hypothetical protein COV18_04545 [Candidatus Woesearchaeota archaeon CG10_big_fil_rev_8_21_14_0_10_37_12]